MLEEFITLVTKEVGLEPAYLKTEKVGEILARYYQNWSINKNPMWVDFCVEDIYETL